MCSVEGQGQSLIVLAREVTKGLDWEVESRGYSVGFQMEHRVRLQSAMMQ